MNTSLPSFSDTQSLRDSNGAPNRLRGRGPRRIADTIATRRERWALMGFLLLLAIALFAPAISQPEHYHQFADRRVLGGVPFAMDVLSNAAFALWAVMGAWYWVRLEPEQRASAWGYSVALFLLGLWLTTFGSAWYHLAPENSGLVIDRAAMTVAFAGLLALAFAERVSARSALGAALVVLAGGAAALVVWADTGNLTPWVAVQGGGMLALLAIAAVPAPQGKVRISWLAVIAIYALAKGCESADHEIFQWSQGWISGHTLKHLVASCAAAPVLRALRVASRQNHQ